MEGFSATQRTRMTKGICLDEREAGRRENDDQQWPADDRTRIKGTSCLTCD